MYSENSGQLVSSLNYIHSSSFVIKCLADRSERTSIGDNYNLASSITVIKIIDWEQNDFQG